MITFVFLKMAGIKDIARMVDFINLVPRYFGKITHTKTAMSLISEDLKTRNSHVMRIFLIIVRQMIQ